MAALSRSSDGEVLSCMNEARLINLFCDDDREALTDVMKHYLTFGNPSDTEDEDTCNDSDDEERQF